MPLIYPRSDDSAFNNWISKILYHIEILCGATAQHGIQELSEVKKVMAIAPTDKSAHDLMMVCKRLYQSEIYNELHFATYTSVNIPDNELCVKNAEYAIKLGRPPVNAHAYLYGAVKLHKEPILMRWITGNKKVISPPRRRVVRKPAISISAIGSALGGIQCFTLKGLADIG